MNIEMFEEAMGMFLFLALELSFLFLLISYLVGVLQSYIPPEKIQKILGSKKGRGYIIAAFLGAITPFCSCSTIPFLKGLLRAKAGFGPMLVFLFSSPLLNPIIIGLFFVTFGIKVTVIYFSIALGVSVLSGIFLEKIGFEKYVKLSAYEAEVKKCSDDEKEVSKKSKWKEIWNSTWKDFVSLSPYLFGGIAIGSFIYGFIPTEFIAQYSNKDNVLAIPIAAIIGIPLYIRAEAVIPLSAALASKGMSLGAVMALIIGSAGASLTEVVLLKSIFKNKLIITFLVVILGMAMLSGYIFQIFGE